MLSNISDRQKQLLLAILQEYMDTAEAVGSLEISDNYDFDISPATIRNEMADLMKMGFLFKTHTSGGRIPTTQAWRFYLSEVMDEEETEPVKEIQTREQIFKSRFSKESLLKESVDILAQLTKCCAIALTDNNTFFSGLSNLLNYPEFRNLDELQKILLFVENPSVFNKVIKRGNEMNNVNILIGEELGVQSLRNSAMVFSQIDFHRNDSATISVLGPARMNYSRVVPSLKGIVKNINEVTQSW